MKFSKTRLFTGAGDRSRTYDLRITNALLYQLSYTGNGVNYKVLSNTGQTDYLCSGWPITPMKKRIRP